MGSVPTIARHASRSALHQFDGMTPTTPLHRERRKAEMTRHPGPILDAGGNSVLWDEVSRRLTSYPRSGGPKVKRSERSEREALNLQAPAPKAQ